MCSTSRSLCFVFWRELHKDLLKKTSQHKIMCMWKSCISETTFWTGFWFCFLLSSPKEPPIFLCTKQSWPYSFCRIWCRTADFNFVIYVESKPEWTRMFRRIKNSNVFPFSLLLFTFSLKLNIMWESLQLWWAFCYTMIRFERRPLLL